MTNPAVSSAEGPEVAEAVRGVLMLPSPPAPHGLEAWYWTPVTGVPFLLLNLLQLQRGGVTHVTVFHPALKDLSPARREALAADPRLSADVVWENDPVRLQDALAHPACRLVAHGGALHTPSEVRSALDPGEPAGARPKAASREEMETLLNQWIQTRPPGEARVPPVWLSGHPDFKVAAFSDFSRLNRQRLRASGLSNDSLLDRWITRHISRQITRVFLKTPLTPNQITLIAMAVGLAGAGCFLLGSYAGGVAGAALVLISAWIDCSDGEVARLRLQETPLGGTLDIWADNLVHAAAFFSLGMGLYFSTEQGIYKFLGGVAVVGTLVSFALLHSAVVESKTRAAQGDSGAAGSAVLDHLANRDFTYVLFALALIDQLPVFLILTAFGSNVFAAWLAYRRFQSCWNASGDWCSKNSE